MVQANAAGRKNQTRRVINPQPSGFIDDPHFEWLVPVNGAYKNGVPLGQPKGGLMPVIKCPYGYPGDVLFTRETWAKNEQDGQFDYKSDYPSTDHFFGWKPAIHMPTAAARYFHRITSIRAERIMVISDEDCINEGIESYTEDRLKSKPTRYKLYSLDQGEESDPPLYCSNPIDSYRSLWQLINGKPKPIQIKQNGKLITTGYIVYPWGNVASLKPYEGLTEWRGKPLTVVPNPWVWRIEYETIEKPTNI